MGNTDGCAVHDHGCVSAARAVPGPGPELSLGRGTTKVPSDRDDRTGPSSMCVELWGFEPQTPSMRTRCATRLRHSPRETRIDPLGPTIRLAGARELSARRSRPRSAGATLGRDLRQFFLVHAGQVDRVHVVQLDVVVVDA